MLVFYRNGKQVVLSGWRAWLVILPVMILASLFTVAIASLFLGVAFTFATLFLIGLPIAIVLSAIVQLFQRRR